MATPQHYNTAQNAYTYKMKKKNRKGIKDICYVSGDKYSKPSSRSGFDYTHENKCEALFAER
jgi:hypothetical protein